VISEIIIVLDIENLPGKYGFLAEKIKKPVKI